MPKKTMYLHGDKAVFNHHVYMMVKVTADKKAAEECVTKLRKQGFRARLSLRTRTKVPKEPTGSYFAGHGGFTVETWYVWKGATRSGK